jgi:hypothetical protein
VAGGQLIHGDHGAGGLLAPQLQHGEQVQRHGAHVRQRSHLHSACSVLCHILKFLAIWKLYYTAGVLGIVHNVLYKWTVGPCGTVYCTYVCYAEVGEQTLFKSPKSKIRKFLGSFHYRKSTNCIHSFPARK